MAVSGNYAYVANSASNNVSVIDTTTNSVVRTVSVGTTPRSLVATPDGSRVYVANAGTQNVSVIDTNTNSVVATIPVQAHNYGFDLAVSPDGKRVYVADQYGSGVSVIDVDPTSPTYNTVIRTANVAYLGPNPDIKVSADGTRLYETSDPYGNVVVVNTATMTVVDTIDVSDPYDSYYPEALAFRPNGKRAYAAAGYVSEGGYVYAALFVIDTDPTSATYNEQIAAIALPVDDQGIFYSDYSGVFDVALSPDGSRAYVTSFDGKTVAVINTASNTLIGTFTIDEGAGDSNLRRSIAVGADGTLYIADGDGTVYAVTVSNPTML